MCFILKICHSITLKNSWLSFKVTFKNFCLQHLQQTYLSFNTSFAKRYYKWSSWSHVLLKTFKICFLVILASKFQELRYGHLLSQKKNQGKNYDSPYCIYPDLFSYKLVIIGQFSYLSKIFPLSIFQVGRIHFFQ